MVMLACGTTLATAMVLGALDYFRTMRITMEMETNNLANETQLMSLRIKNKYDGVKDDALTISGMPPVDGIIRSIKNGGVDSVDKSDLKSWEGRFAKILLSVMARNSHYRHIQFIGIKNGGREIVRVDRVGEEFVITPKKNLEVRSQEGYFREVVANDDFHGVHISGVSYDKDGSGANEAEETPIIDVTLPIYHAGELFGMLVINVDYNAMFVNAFKENKWSRNTFIVNDVGEYIEYRHKKGEKILVTNETGEYLEYRRNEESSDLKFHREKSYPEFLDAFKNSEENALVSISDDYVFYGKKLTIDNHGPGRSPWVILKASRQELMKEVHRSRNENVALALIVIIASLLVTFFLTGRLTKSLRMMTKEVSSSTGKKVLSLPIHLTDEVGELARAFEKKAEDLLTSEEKMSAVMNSILDGIITVDREGRIYSYSDACREIFGYEKHEALGKSFNFLLKNSYGEIEHFVSQRHEFVGFGKDGREFPLEVSVNKIVLNDHDLFCCVVRDISERKQIESMKSEFISTVNHEIRTPLTSIQGSLGLLRIRLKEKLDEKNRKLLDISYSNCERLTLLVNDILDLEKIIAGKMEYNLETTEICGVVRNVVEANYGYAQKYDVKFSIVQEVGKTNCRIDVNRFGQALTNLLSNAAKFSRQGGEVVIAIKSHDGDKVTISVSDNGEGIPLEFHSKIFQRFAQADSSSDRKKDGTGLGLSITKSIVEALSGTIGFDTKEGIGTTFYITLPTQNNFTV